MLDSAETGELMAALESRLLESEARRLVDRKGEPLEGLERHLMTISLLSKRFPRPMEILRLPEVRDRLRQSLPPEAQQELLHGSDRSRPEFQFRIMAIMVLSLRQEIERYIADELRPTMPQLLSFFEREVPKPEQEQLTNLAAPEFQRQLRQRYFRRELVSRVDLKFEELQRFLYPEEFLREREGPSGGRPFDREPPLVVPYGPWERGFLPRFNGDRDGRPPEGRPPPPDNGRPDGPRPDGPRPEGPRPEGGRADGGRPDGARPFNGPGRDDRPPPQGDRPPGADRPPGGEPPPRPRDGVF